METDRVSGGDGPLLLSFTGAYEMMYDNDRKWTIHDGQTPVYGNPCEDVGLQGSLSASSPQLLKGLARLSPRPFQLGTCAPVSANLNIHARNYVTGERRPTYSRVTEVLGTL